LSTCPTGNYLSEVDSSCSTCTQTGWFISGTMCRRCYSSCLTCSGSLSTNCLSCDFSNLGLSLIQNQGTCGTCTSGTFRSSSNVCTNCDPTCKECSGPLDYHCTACDNTNGLYLQSTGLCSSICDVELRQIYPTSCYSISAKYYFQFSLEKLTINDPSASDEVRIKITVTPQSPAYPPQIIADLPQIAFELSNSLKQAWTPDQTGWVPTLSFSPSSISPPTISLSFAPPSNLPTGKYSLSFSLASSPLYYPPLGADGNYSLYKILQSDSVVSLDVIREKLTAAESRSIENGKMLGSIINPGVLRNNPDVMEIILLITNADPTGLFTQFTQILKLLNRLYFININYGNIAELFFLQIEKAGGTQRQGTQDPDARQRVWRGKLSKKDVLGNYPRVFYVRIIVYFTLWLLRLASRFLVELELRAPKLILIIIFYLPRVHLIVFNYVLMDALFYGSRSMLQFELPIWNYAVTCLCFVLASADIINLLKGLFLKQAIKGQKLQQKQLQSQLKKIDNQGDLDNNGLKHFSTRLEPPQKEAKCTIITPVKVSDNGAKNRSLYDRICCKGRKGEEAACGKRNIDYRETYRNIDLSNTHLLHFLTAPLSDVNSLAKSSVFSLVIIIIPLRYLRILCYNVLIVSTQLVPSVCLACLILVEVIAVVTCSITQWKYKGFKSTMVYLIETLPSFFLLSFLICSSFSLSTTSPSEGLQNMTIYSYISTLCAEYILLFLHSINSTDQIQRPEMLQRSEQQ
jgi:hypothetical protein